MSDDIINQEKTYWSKEIAESLEIQPVTLRKWCKLLEDRGYRFLRDEHDRRAFTEHDAIALRKFKELTKDKAMSQDSASEVVVSKYNRDNQQPVAPSATALSIRSEQRYAELLETMEEVSKTVGELREENQEQKAFNKALLEQFEKQQKYIEDSIKARDERFMAALREIQEQQQQKLIAAAQEEQKKKGFWRRLLGK